MQFYVLPTVEGLPPRTVMAEQFQFADNGEIIVTDDAIVATYDDATSSWCVDEQPLHSDLSEAITDRARFLGVEL